MPRKTIMHFRVREEERDLLRAAARLQESTVSDLLRGAALREARDIINAPGCRPLRLMRERRER